MLAVFFLVLQLACSEAVTAGANCLSLVLAAPQHVISLSKSMQGQIVLACVQRDPLTREAAEL